jgi:peptidoglycan hydrolase CwlO-like protein
MMLNKADMILMNAAKKIEKKIESKEREIKKLKVELAEVKKGIKAY